MVPFPFSSETSDADHKSEPTDDSALELRSLSWPIPKAKDSISFAPPMETHPKSFLASLADQLVGLDSGESRGRGAAESAEKVRTENAAASQLYNEGGDCDAVLKYQAKYRPARGSTTDSSPRTQDVSPSSDSPDRRRTRPGAGPVGPMDDDITPRPKPLEPVNPEPSPRPSPYRPKPQPQPCPRPG